MAQSASLPQDIGLWQIRGIASLALTPSALLLFSLIYARGDRRRSVSKSWFAAVFAAGAIPVGSVILYPNDLVALVTMIDEGTPWTVVLGKSGITIQYTMLISAVLILINLERTFRASVGTMRWRIKFMIIGLVALMLVRLYTSSQVILFNNAHPSLNLLNSIGLLVACLLMLRTLLRSGHFEIEVYPSQAVLQNSLTIFVVGAYLVAVGLFAKLATFLGGDTAFPIKALGILISLVLLGLLLQSDKFRLHIRQFVSRHFQRPLYDYQTIWKRVTEETASHTSSISLCSSLTALISEVFDALSVSIWIIEESPSKLKLYASTTLLDPVGTEIQLPPSVDLNQIFAENKGRVDLDRKDSSWSEVLKTANPKKFPHGGNRICIPMTARDTLLGVIVLGDRVGGERFAEQEFDVLTSVGNHAASALLNLQLSRKLLETRELEAFQTMAAFFVHDLKNAASTLNIMVKNLPIHWDNPEFRTDALRGITKTGDRINQLIGRLSTVQEELEINVRTLDIDTLAQSVADGWQPPERVDFKTVFDSKAQANIDAEQMGRVLLNLIINASESMDTGGAIEFRTEATESHAIFAISDEGCGMSNEFIQKSLFRPFMTTKKRGLGIGMFQSKLIVEAHRGRLEVESEVGKGSTFRVVLPREESEALSNRKVR
jgi:putative PEP-CTERM system histidine kinase